MFDYKIFGSRLEKLRKEKGISAAALAKVLGVSSTQIGDMERGNSATTMPRLYHLCVYFGVSADYLLGLKDEEN